MLASAMARARNLPSDLPEPWSASPLLNFLRACMAAAAPRLRESASSLSPSTKYFLCFLTASSGAPPR